MVSTTTETISLLFSAAFMDSKQIVWNPVMHSPLFTTDALALIAKDYEGGYYVILRGVNPINAWSWLARDYPVLEQLPGAAKQEAYSDFVYKPVDLKKQLKAVVCDKNMQDRLTLALSPFISLWEYVNIRDDTEQSIRDYLVANAGSIKHLFITGCSLEGLVAPTYALWLYENAQELRSIPTTVYSSAGFMEEYAFLIPHSENSYTFNLYSSCEAAFYAIHTHDTLNNVKLLLQTTDNQTTQWECTLINTFLPDAHRFAHSRQGLPISLKISLANLAAMFDEAFILRVIYQQLFSSCNDYVYKGFNPLFVLIELVVSNLDKIPDRVLYSIERITGKDGRTLQEQWRNTISRYHTYCETNNLPQSQCQEFDVDTFLDKMAQTDNTLYCQFQDILPGLIDMIQSI